MAHVQQFAAEARRSHALAVLIAPLVLLGGAAGLLYAQFKPPGYTASAYVIVVATPESAPGTALSYAQAFGRIARHPDVLAWSTVRGGTSVAPSRIRAMTSPETPLIQVVGRSGTAARSAAYANAAADALVEYGNGHRSETGVRLAWMSKASAPARATSPNLPVDVAVGAATGLLLGALLAAGARGGQRQRGSTGRHGDRPGDGYGDRMVADGGAQSPYPPAQQAADPQAGGQGAGQVTAGRQ